MNRRRSPSEKKLHFKAVKAFPRERKRLRMKSPLHILHLEDNQNDTALIKAALEAEGIAFQVTRVETRADFTAALERGGIDIIFSDFTLPAFDGLSALEIVSTKWPDLPVILISGTLGEEQAIDSLKRGATDY